MADDDDDDVWQPEEDNEEEDNDDDVEEEEPAIRPKKQPLQQQPKRKRSRNVYEDTSERMTENGGYAHTMNSKLKISKANKGNTPWNKVREKKREKGVIGAFCYAD
jgi:NUMOD3 motif